MKISRKFSVSQKNQAAAEVSLFAGSIGKDRLPCRLTVGNHTRKWNRDCGSACSFFRHGWCALTTSFRFDLLHQDSLTAARVGRWTTPHGPVSTPAFMPVGTAATVKGLTPEQLREAGAEMILANTYHLALRPGPEVVANLGGLHGMMAWDGPILTDSGGFQVFSLARLLKMSEKQAVFRSHIDGSLLELSPERAVAIQEQLGADCMMCLDECLPHDAPRQKLREAVERTTRWAARCQAAQTRSDQALLGIVQGGIDQELREHSARGLLELNFPAYAIGGLSVGEEPRQMYETLDFTVPLLPADRPRYLMGVGKPVDLIEGVMRGIDLFDCVMPSRNGRNATAFTSTGVVRMRNRCHQSDPQPLDAACHCPVCRRFSRGYLRHLFLSKEMLGPILLSWHNIAFYQNLMRELREAIVAGQVQEFRSVRLAQWNEPN